ncbi:hypothetical protein LMCDFJHI_02900 [Aeromonas salmonicida]
MFQPLAYRPAAPLLIPRILRLGSGATILLGDGQQILGGTVTQVEHHGLDLGLQLRRYVFIDGELTSVDYAHVHAVLDGVVEEDSVDGFAHRFIAAKRERDVGDTARDHGMGQMGLDVLHRLDEVHRIVVVLVDAGRHREDIGIEDDVFRRKTHLIHQDPVGALADLKLAGASVSLAHLIERHDDDGGAIATQQFGLLDEFLLPLLHGDGVDHRLALHALEAGFQHLPLGGVDHHRHSGDIRLTGDEVQEAHHGRFGVQHPLVHVDVDDLGAALHLLLGHIEGFVVEPLLDETLEFGGTGDVGTLTHVHKHGVRRDDEGLETRQAAGDRQRGQGARLDAGDSVTHGANMGRGGAAAAPHHVEKTALGPLADMVSHLTRIEIVLAERIGQTGVGVGAHKGLADARQLLHILAQLVGPQRTVQTERDGFDMAQGVIEGFGGLTGESTARGIRDGAGDHHRQAVTQRLKHPFHREGSRLGVEGIEDGLDQNEVGATLDQGMGRLRIRSHQLVIGDVALAGIVHVRRDGAGAVGGTQHTGDKARSGGVPSRPFVCHGTGQPGRLAVDLGRKIFHLVIGHGDASGVEGVGFEDVGPGGTILIVDLANDPGPGQHQQVVVALDVGMPVGKPLTAIIRLAQLVALDHGAHGPVDDQDPFLETGFQFLCYVRLYARLFVQHRSLLLHPCNCVKVILAANKSNGNLAVYLSTVESTITTGYS